MCRTSRRAPIVPTPGFPFVLEQPLRLPGRRFDSEEGGSGCFRPLFVNPISTGSRPAAEAAGSAERKAHLSTPPAARASVSFRRPAALWTSSLSRMSTIGPPGCWWAAILPRRATPPCPALRPPRRPARSRIGPGPGAVGERAVQAGGHGAALCHGDRAPRHHSSIPGTEPCPLFGGTPPAETDGRCPPRTAPRRSADQVDAPIECVDE